MLRPAPVQLMAAPCAPPPLAVACRQWTDPEWGTARKAAFVAAARHAHGCTALCLSGGGAIAMYHMGVVRELLAAGLLPSVVSGTSGGAIVAALLACRTDDELPDFLCDECAPTLSPIAPSPMLLGRVVLPDCQQGPPRACAALVQPVSLTEPRDTSLCVLTCPHILHSVSTRDGQVWFDDYWTMLRRFVEDGVVVSKDKFLAALYPICGDLTFAEAFARTGRLVNLSTSTTSLGATLLLNHIITPNVLVRSAVQASCALPGVMRPSALLAKSREGEIVPFETAGLLFRDGSFQSDIPMRELSAQFHCTHFIVSQVRAAASWWQLSAAVAVTILPALPCAMPLSC